MKLLCIGNSGQVAQALVERCGIANVPCIALGRPILDLLKEQTVKTAIDKHAPSIIVNAAAYTAVDKAESEEAAAFAVNAQACEMLAKQAHARDIPLIHLSTDYVFDGSKSEPYTEADPIKPLGAYGRSKAAGEDAIRLNTDKHIILRTAWVYSPFGNNFVKTMLRLAEGRDALSVVDDQIGNPTNALDIADGIIAICQTGIETDKYGTYHMTGSGKASWADLAALVFDLYQEMTGKHVSLVRIPSSEYPTPAERPKNSQLDCAKLASAFNVRLLRWQDSAEKVVRRLLKERTDLS